MKDTNKSRKYLLLKLSQFSKLYSIINKLEDCMSLKCFGLGNGEYELFYYIDLDILFLTKKKEVNGKSFSIKNGASFDNLLYIRNSYILDNYPVLAEVNTLYERIELGKIEEINLPELKLINKLYKNLNDECDTKQLIL